MRGRVPLRDIYKILPLKVILRHLASSLMVKKLWIEGRKVDFIGGLDRRVGILG